ncbi:hypothetical protein [Pseudomonas fluorescens]|uniref:hypothetical protein n=1 Tax=Pseudomonas fluorescens TaxID=294 RepID=UPI0012421F07|nr:hypothetical protein [Pseudomonas fluorescens]
MEYDPSTYTETSRIIPDQGAKVPNEVRLSVPGKLIITRGNNLNTSVAAAVLGPNGASYPNEAVDWLVSTDPVRSAEITGIQIQNATVKAANVQSNFTVTVTVTVRSNPALHTSNHFDVQVF